MTSKGNQTAPCASGFRGSLRGIPASGDKHLVAPNLPQELVRVPIAAVLVFDTGDTRFNGMKVSKVRESLFRLRDEVSEGWFWVLHPHSLPGIPRGDSESDSVFANSIGDGFEDFEREPGTILDRSAVSVRPLVRDVLEELVREVSVGEVELDAIESCLIDGLVSGGGMPLDVGVDFFDRQRTRGRVRRGHGDGGWADQFEAGILGFEQFDVRGAAESPKLEKDV